MPERDLLNDIRVALSKLGCRMFRNNVGTGWVGRLTRHEGGSVTLANARPLHAGLCVGSSDLIGWTPYTVQPGDVGRSLALFTAIEGKTGRRGETNEQATFRQAVTAAGGIAVAAWDVGEAVAAVTRP